MTTSKRRYMLINLQDFINLAFPDNVFKLKKALYRLKQTPRAWYDYLSKFLLKH